MPTCSVVAELKLKNFRFPLSEISCTYFAIRKKLVGVSGVAWDDQWRKLIAFFLYNKKDRIICGNVFWAHIYLTVSSRPTGSCVQSLVQIGSEM
jgi:hypothetical protein